MMANTMDLESQLYDSYQEERQARYLELIGHNDNYLYVPFDEWTPDLFRCVEKQGEEKERWNCPSYSEICLNYATSEYIKDDVKPYFIPSGSTCAVCFEPLTSTKNAYITECNHHFCKTCITSHYNATFLSKNFSCPLCRHKLHKCMWLESRYALEPWRLTNRTKISTNVDFEFQRQYFNEDILLCKGCNCREGCNKLIGTSPSCLACKAWKQSNLEELRHVCGEQPPPQQKKERRCCSWSEAFNCIMRSLSFIVTYRRGLIFPHSSQ